MAKTRWTSCTNSAISFGVSWFRTRTHLLHGHLIFLNLFELQTFLHSICTIQSEVINFQHVLTSFAIFQSFTDLFRELNDPEIEKYHNWTLKRLKLGMVSSFHPHGMFKKVEMVTAKTGCTSCTNWTFSFEVSGLRTKTHLLQRDFIFWTYFNSRLFCVQNAPFKATSSIFNPFWLHLLFFMQWRIVLS